jgi:hypothetical protein
LIRRARSIPEVPGGQRLMQRIFTRLGCRGRPPDFVVEYYPYANLTHTLRFRKGIARVRFSDLLEGEPLAILEAAAAILLARAYRKTPPLDLAELYRRYAQSPGARGRLAAARRKRCRPVFRAADHFAIEPMFDALNRRYFAGSLRKPRLGWSLQFWRSQLGSFDPSLDRIVLNRRLDRPDVPRYVVEYILYHEMLHVKHPGQLARCGFQVHSAPFRAEERRFARYEEARRWLERIR